MKVIFLLLLVAILNSCSLPKFLKVKNMESLEVKNKFVKIEIDDLIFIDTQFSSNEINKIALDLGAGSTTLIKNSGSVYIDTLHSEMEFGYSISANNKISKKKYYRVSKMQSEGFSLINAFVPAVDNFQNDACRDFTGVWGATTFDEKCLVLKIEDSTMAVFDSIPSLEGWTLVETDYSYPFFYVYVNIGGKDGDRIRLLLDTGSSSSMVLSSKYFKRKVRKSTSLLSDRSVFYGNTFVSSSGLVLDTVVTYKCGNAFVGNFQLSDPKVIVSNKIRGNILGMDVLTQFNIMVDYKNKQLYFQKNPSYVPPSAHSWFLHNGFSMRVNKNSELVVSALKLNSSAERGGLLPGDILLSVNDLKICDIDICDALKVLSVLPVNESFEAIKVARNGQIIELRLE